MSARITKATLVAELAAAHAEIARLEALLEKPAPATPAAPVAMDAQLKARAKVQPVDTWAQLAARAKVRPVVTWFTKADGSCWRKERIGNDARSFRVSHVGA